MPPLILDSRGPFPIQPLLYSLCTALANRAALAVLRRCATASQPIWRPRATASRAAEPREPRLPRFTRANVASLVRHEKARKREAADCSPQDVTRTAAPPSEAHTQEMVLDSRQCPARIEWRALRRVAPSLLTETGLADGPSAAVPTGHVPTRTPLRSPPLSWLADASYGWPLHQRAVVISLACCGHCTSVLWSLHQRAVVIVPARCGQWSWHQRAVVTAMACCGHCTSVLWSLHWRAVVIAPALLRSLHWRAVVMAQACCGHCTGVLWSLHWRAGGIAPACCDHRTSVMWSSHQRAVVSAPRYIQAQVPGRGTQGRAIWPTLAGRVTQPKGRGRAGQSALRAESAAWAGALRKRREAARTRHGPAGGGRLEDEARQGGPLHTAGTPSGIRTVAGPGKGRTSFANKPPGLVAQCERVPYVCVCVCARVRACACAYVRACGARGPVSKHWTVSTRSRSPQGHRT